MPLEGQQEDIDGLQTAMRSLHALSKQEASIGSHPKMEVLPSYTNFCNQDWNATGGRPEKLKAFLRL